MLGGVIEMSDLPSSLNSYLQQPLVSSACLVVWNGSKKSESDIDLMVVSSFVQQDEGRHFDGVIDAKIYSKDMFLFRSAMWDVEVTETILGGAVVHGDCSLFHALKGKFLYETPTDVVLRYLRFRSIECLSQAIQLYGRGLVDVVKQLYEKNVSPEISRKEMFTEESSGTLDYSLRKSLNMLSYAISYESFAQSYERGDRGVTLLTLLQDYTNPLNEHLRESITVSRNAKLSKILPETVRFMIDKTRMVLGGEPLVTI